MNTDITDSDRKEIIAQFLDRLGFNGLERVRAWQKIDEIIDEANESSKGDGEKRPH